MDPQTSIDIARQAVHVGLWISAPMLIAGVLVGLIVGVLQAMTQIHDQTIQFVAKLVVTALIISLCLPWIFEHFGQYSRTLIQDIPHHLAEP